MTYENDCTLPEELLELIAQQHEMKNGRDPPTYTIHHSTALQDTTMTRRGIHPLSLNGRYPAFRSLATILG